MKELFATNGRYNRSKFWLRALLIGFCYAVFTGILINIDSIYIPSILLYMSIPFIIVMLTNIVRRLHDLNMSGWFVLLVVVPLGNFVLGILLAFMKGTEGPNNYGEDPLGVKLI